VQPRSGIAISRSLVLVGYVCGLAFAQQTGVIVRFDPSTPTVGPFPTDYLTIPDSTQKTGLMIHLPVPDCTKQPSECTAATLLNHLDGFHLQPRINVNFSGPVDPTTLKAGIYFVWLDNLTSDEKGLAPQGQITAINEIIYDPATLTAYAKPNDFFDQHRRYALIVTDAVHDTAGKPVSADPNFTACVQSPQNAYCQSLKSSLSLIGGGHGNVVAASVFTTMSATAWMEKARDLLPQVPLGFKPVGVSVSAAQIVAVNYLDQPGGSRSLSVDTTSGALTGVDRIVFGSYQSPKFFNSDQFIPDTPTLTALAAPPANNTIQFHAYIPSSPMPPNGYPVIIYGHAYGENSYFSPTLVASTFAQAGFVTLAINAVGNGYGPQSVVEIVQKGNVVTSFPGGGRGVDLNGDGVIDFAEGCFIGWPNPVGARDCYRQTVTDQMQLVNLVRSGVAIDPSSSLKLDATRIYNSGLSLGAYGGTIFHALEPSVRAAAPTSGGGSSIDTIRWTHSHTLQALAEEVVAGHMPSLLNGCSVASCNGLGYNDNNVLRDQPPKVNDVAGAIGIQNLFGELNWLNASGDPLSYAPHLSLSPLPNVPAKPVLYLYAFGDLTVPNPLETDLIRAAGPSAGSTLYRTDLAETAAKSIGETLPPGYDPHVFLVDSYTNRTTTFVAQAVQREIAGFLASDGKTIPDPNAIIKQLFPVPLTVTLFETVAGSVVTNPPPVIASVTSATGILDSVQPNIQAGSFVAIYGSNLANGTADWSGLINNGQLPTLVDGVSVTIGGKAAYVNFVSPGQINVLAPDAAIGDVQVIVTNNGISSAPAIAHLQTAAPAFFQWGATKYALATRYPDNAPVANPSIGPGYVAAKPGDTLILWGTGFGPTTPPQNPGLLTSGTHNLAQQVTVTVGGVSANVVGAALSPGLAGVYQIAIKLPDSVPAGDVLVKAKVGGFATPDNVDLFVAR
jgi:uncharacterized protein (TIGR03437 family)